MKKQTKKLILMLVIGLVIGIITVKIFTPNQRFLTKIDSSTPQGTETTLPTVLPSTGEILTATKQYSLPPAIPLNSRLGLHITDQVHSSTVFVTTINVDVISWVAIYDEHDGKPGSILGAQKVKPGETTTTVELLRAEGTLPGLTYFAAILPDDGDGTFNRLTDLPPFSSEKYIIVKFKSI